jgi:sialate O-acetylesterase
MSIEARGPILRHVDVVDDQLVVQFDHADGLTTLDGEAPTGFWIADDTKSWVVAEARLEGDTVVLQSPALRNPLYVRYAFAGKPRVNLINAAGLPAYPFRTDNFPP